MRVAHDPAPQDHPALRVLCQRDARRLHCWGLVHPVSMHSERLHCLPWLLHWPCLRPKQCPPACSPVASLPAPCARGHLRVLHRSCSAAQTQCLQQRGHFQGSSSQTTLASIPWQAPDSLGLVLACCQKLLLESSQIRPPQTQQTTQVAVALTACAVVLIGSCFSSGCREASPRTVGGWDHTEDLKAALCQSRSACAAVPPSVAAGSGRY
jgi:hypothetical protein